MPRDVDVRIGDHRFNFRVAALIRREDRILTCSLDGAGFCFLPGGRVHAGEASRLALERELREELGIDARVGLLAMVVENFFDGEGTRFHEMGLYYRVEVPSEWEPADTVTSGDGAVFRWVAVEDLAGADLRPALLCEALRRELVGTAHWVHVET